jgi:hypothetical protein
MAGENMKVKKCTPLFLQVPSPHFVLNYNSETIQKTMEALFVIPASMAIGKLAPTKLSRPYLGNKIQNETTGDMAQMLEHLPKKPHRKFKKPIQNGNTHLL